MMETSTYTFSALTDILSESFARYKSLEFPAPGNYYYHEIKAAKFEQRPIKVVRSILECIIDKTENFTITEKRNLISRALRDFAFRNISASDAEMFCKNMRWLIA